MLIVFIRAVILYLALILGIRLMGKRQIGELQPSELVTTVLLSNIATLPVEDTGIPMIMGIIPIYTLISLDVIMSYVSLKWRKVRKLVCGSPKVVISNGRVDQKQLIRLRYTADDLLASLRSMSIFDISEVQLAVVETNGSLSVYQKKASQPVTCEDMKIKGESTDPPQLIIDSGKLIPGALEGIGFDRRWLDSTLKAHGSRLSDVFLMTCDSSGKHVIIPFERQAKGL